jgi:cell division protein ZapA
MMAELAIMIDGRVYRVACDEGEEVRLGDLAQLVDAKISALRQRFGEIGDQRLVIMAAITSPTNGRRRTPASANSKRKSRD